MDMMGALVKLAIIVAVITQPGSAADSRKDANHNQRFNGLAAPDPHKICISVRLPWENDPMYFCTDKENVRYRRQCGARHYACAPLGNHSLIVSTPWDCCPLETNPDYCNNVECPLKPFNRTCIEIPKPNQTSESEIPFTQECCPRYFCEENMKHDECHLEITKPSCTQPPKGKSNCIAFMDPFSCCPKFQCEGEGKPGLCPMELYALKYNIKANTTAVRTDKDTNEDEDTDENVDENTANINHDSTIGYVSLARYQHQCIGDFNCAGKMKCCSMDYHTYSDNTFARRNTNPVAGFCMDPTSKAAKFNSETLDVQI